MAQDRALEQSAVALGIGPGASTDFEGEAQAVQYAKDNGKDYVRLDTLGNNTRLIEYYSIAGFRFLGMFDLKNTEGLPAHYGNVPACLFEIKL